MPYLLQDPDTRLDYTCDWSDYLADFGSPSVNLLSSSWAVTPQDGSPEGPVITSSSNTNTTTSVVVESFLRGQVYQLTNTVVVDVTPQVDDQRSITIRCENR